MRKTGASILRDIKLSRALKNENS